MQDLSRYRKKSHIEIQSRYVSLLLAGSVALVGLVFALGVLVGSRRVTETSCEEADPLAALDLQSGEPEPPSVEEGKLRTYHDTLGVSSSKVPTPASLEQVGPEDPVKGPALVEPEQVALERPRHDEDPVPQKVADAEPGTYSLQVASFQDQREASLMVRRLEKAGHKAFLVSVNMPDRGGMWYRVRVGPFQSKKNAWSYKKTFEDKERLATFVVKRRS